MSKLERLFLVLDVLALLGFAVYTALFPAQWDVNLTTRSVFWALSIALAIPALMLFRVALTFPCKERWDRVFSWERDDLSNKSGIEESHQEPHADTFGRMLCAMRIHEWSDWSSPLLASQGSTGITNVERRRFEVRGHWKQQAHGKGLSERKPIFVEPYWKGPDMGSVVQRDYLVK